MCDSDSSRSSGSSSDFDDDSFCKDSVVAHGRTRELTVKETASQTLKASLSEKETDTVDEDDSFCRDSVRGAGRGKRRQRGPVSHTDSESDDDIDDESYCRDSVVMVGRNGNACALPRVISPPKGRSPAPILVMQQQPSPNSLVRRAPPPALLQLSKSLYVSSLSLNGSSAHSRIPTDQPFSDQQNDDEDSDDDASEFSEDSFDDDYGCAAKDTYTACHSLDLSYMQQQPSTQFGSRAA